MPDSRSVTAKDFSGREVSDTDDFSTVPAAAQSPHAPRRSSGCAGLVQRFGIQRRRLDSVDRAQSRPARFHRLLELGLRQLRTALLAALTDGLERAFLEIHAASVDATPTLSTR
jgi:hypothetical protein